MAERAVAADPELKAAYFSRIMVALQERDDAAALAWLKRTAEATGHRFGDLRKNPNYTKFVRSPEYREWLAWEEGRPGS